MAHCKDFQFSAFYFMSCINISKTFMFIMMIGNLMSLESIVVKWTHGNIEIHSFCSHNKSLCIIFSVAESHFVIEGYNIYHPNTNFMF